MGDRHSIIVVADDDKVTTTIGDTHTTAAAALPATTTSDEQEKKKKRETLRFHNLLLLRINQCGLWLSLTRNTRYADHRSHFFLRLVCVCAHVGWWVVCDVRIHHAVGAMPLFQDQSLLFHIFFPAHKYKGTSAYISHVQIG